MIVCYIEDMTEAEKMKKIVTVAVNALLTDGEHHKQYALEEIAILAGYKAPPTEEGREFSEHYPGYVQLMGYELNALGVDAIDHEEYGYERGIPG